MGLNRIAKAELERSNSDTFGVAALSRRGINWISNLNERWPLEFDLLDYRPEPWSPIDSLAIEVEFRWYLTGRFPVIVMPEMAR